MSLCSYYSLGTLDSQCELLFDDYGMIELKIVTDVESQRQLYLRVLLYRRRSSERLPVRCSSMKVGNQEAARFGISTYLDFSLKGVLLEIIIRDVNRSG